MSVATLSLPGPAMQRPPLPVGKLLVSAALHVSFFVGLFVAATLMRTEKPKVYVVNLVPAVAAVGSPQGRSEVKEAPREVVRETPRSKPPEELPRRETPRETARAPELPAKSVPKELPRVASRETALPPPSRREVAGLPQPSTRRESQSLPDYPTRPETPADARRPLALPRSGEKELPNIASSTTPRPLPSTVSAPLPPPPPPPPLGRATGSSEGSGALTLRASDFPYAWYLQIVQRKIHQEWAPTSSTPEGAVILFEITREGQVRRATIERSSGNAAYDQAALRAVGAATPFPPLPSGFRDSMLVVHLGFNETTRVR